MEDLTAEVLALYDQRETEFTADVMREVERRLLIAIIDDKWKDHLYEVDQLKTGVGLVGYGQKDPLLEYKKGAFSMFTELLFDVKSDVVKNLFRVRLEQQMGPAAPLPSQMQAFKPDARPQRAGGPGGAAMAPAPRMPVPRSVPTAEESMSLSPAGPSPGRPGAPHSPLVASPGAAPRIIAPALTRTAAPRPSGFSATHAALSGFAAAGAGAAPDEAQPAPEHTPVRAEPKVGRNDPCYCGSGKKFKKCHGAAQ